MEPMTKQIKDPVDILGTSIIAPELTSFKALKKLITPVTIPERIQRTI